MSKEETKQMERQLPKTETKVVMRQISEPITRQVTRPISRQIEKIMTEQINKVSTRQVNKQISKMETKLVTRLIEKQTIKAVVAAVFAEPITVSPVVGIPIPGIPETPPREIIGPPGIPIISLEKDLMKGISLAPQAYDVFVYKPQFKDGKRIRGKEEVKLNKKPLRRTDALALGSDLVDNTAKRTIIIKEAKGKPHKLRKKVRSWSSQMFEYNQRGPNKFVEKNIHAIDSPGEIKEITMKGLEARKRGGRRGKTVVLGDIDKVGGRFEREIGRIGRRVIV